jgi:hypothetical protein
VSVTATIHTPEAIYTAATHIGSYTFRQPHAPAATHTDS